MTYATLFETLKSLGFGGMLGCGFGGLCFAVIGHEHVSISLRDAMLIGAFIGGGVHRLLESAFSWITRPVSRFASYYAALLQALLLDGLIQDNYRRQIVDHLTGDYFGVTNASRAEPQPELTAPRLQAGVSNRPLLNLESDPIEVDALFDRLQRLKGKDQMAPLLASPRQLDSPPPPDHAG